MEIACNHRAKAVCHQPVSTAETGRGSGGRKFMTWCIDSAGDHVVIYGPRQLEIIRHDFDPAKVQHAETVPPKLTGTFSEKDHENPW
jgi:hypothetical protein